MWLHITRAQLTKSIVAVAIVIFASTAALSQVSHHSTQPTTSPGHRFIVPTKGNIGFKYADRFYPVRMNADAFRAQFGEPDQKMMSSDGRTVTYFNYFARGLQVAIRRGECWSYSFHAVPITYPRSGQTWKAADIATDNGIHAGMTFDEATKLSPPREKQASGDTVSATYSWGAIYFEKGLLTGFLITDIDRNRAEGPPR